MNDRLEDTNSQITDFSQLVDQPFPHKSPLTLLFRMIGNFLPFFKGGPKISSTNPHLTSMFIATRLSDIQLIQPDFTTSRFGVGVSGGELLSEDVSVSSLRRLNDDLVASRARLFAAKSKFRDGNESDGELQGIIYDCEASIVENYRVRLGILSYYCKHALASEQAAELSRLRRKISKQKKVVESLSKEKNRIVMEYSEVKYKVGPSGLRGLKKMQDDYLAGVGKVSQKLRSAQKSLQRSNRQLQSLQMEKTEMLDGLARSFVKLRDLELEGYAVNSQSCPRHQIFEARDLILKQSETMEDKLYDQVLTMIAPEQGNFQAELEEALERRLELLSAREASQARKEGLLYEAMNPSLDMGCQRMKDIGLAIQSINSSINALDRSVEATNRSVSRTGQLLAVEAAKVESYRASIEQVQIERRALFNVLLSPFFLKS